MPDRDEPASLTLHIGLPKTGTTFLQYSVLPHLEGVTVLHRAQSHAVLALVKRVREHVRADDDRAATTAGAVLDALGAVTDARHVILTDENISLDTFEPWRRDGPPVPRIVRRLRSLGDAFATVGRRCVVVIGIRRQDQWFGSRYAMSAHHHPDFDQRDFERRVDAITGGYLTPTLGYLDYAALDEQLRTQLGAEGFRLLPAELLQRDPVTALRGLTDVVPGDLVGAYHGGVQVGAPARRNVLSSAPNTWSFSGRDGSIHLDDDRIEGLLRRFAASNEQVAARTGLDLDALGYLPTRSRGGRLQRLVRRAR